MSELPLYHAIRACLPHFVEELEKAKENKSDLDVLYDRFARQVVYFHSQENEDDG